MADPDDAQPAPAPTTQRSPLSAAEQALVSARLVHDAAVAGFAHEHLLTLAAQIRGELATIQLCAEALWQGHVVGEESGPYHEAAAAIARVVGLVETMRKGKP